MTSYRTGKTVAFVTMGCAKNEVDSAHMASRLVQAGYEIADVDERVDAIIVNTCSFIQAATEESIEAMLEVANIESVAAGETKLLVAGCMPARYGSDLESEFGEADAFVPCAREESIVEVMDGLFGIERIGAPGDSHPAFAPGSVSVSAYVKISDGCDRFCSYCTIPSIRGRYHSFAEDEILREAGALVEAGARELVLIAQDTGRWGRDLKGDKDLAYLVTLIAETYADVWVRIMYIQPEGITDRLIEAVAMHDNVCSYFDIPFQHCDETLLRAMNRRGSAASHIALIERIRSRIPDAIVRTTLIAGFPGETDEQFEQLCDFVEQAQMDYVGVFAYSREEGTRAYDLPDQVDDDEKAYRAQRLRDLADDVCTPRVARRVGSMEKVLVCGFEEDGQLYGRAMCQAPDVDGVTYVDGGEPGSVVTVRIEDALLYEMEGTCIDGR